MDVQEDLEATGGVLDVAAPGPSVADAAASPTAAAQFKPNPTPEQVRLMATNATNRNAAQCCLSMRALSYCAARSKQIDVMCTNADVYKLCFCAGCNRQPGGCSRWGKEGG